MASQADWFADNILSLEPRVRSWLGKAGWARADIEDLIQESYARIAAHRLEDIAHPSGYLFRTVRNVAADQLRRKQVVSIRSMADMSKLAVFDDAPDAEAALSAHEELEQLRQAIERLPPKCRAVFVLRKVEGLSQADTARRLGISQNTIEKQVARGMRLCAAWLTRCEPPPEGTRLLGADRVREGR